MAFCELNAPDSKSRLTCGARALAKHNHRDETKGWWGSLSGGCGDVRKVGANAGAACQIVVVVVVGGGIACYAGVECGG